MKFVNYTGKINRHDDYLRVLKQLENQCNYVEYVLVDEHETDFLKKFEHLILSETLKKKWWGTECGKKNKAYKLKASKAVFRYLAQFETLCKYTPSQGGDAVAYTDFGINDIAFLDEKDMPLLFTTTHEGYVFIREDFLKS